MLTQNYVKKFSKGKIMSKLTKIFLTVIALLVITDCYAGVADGLDKLMNPQEPAVQKPKVKPKPKFKPPLHIYKESNAVIAPQSKDEHCIAGDCVNGYGTYDYLGVGEYVGEFKDGKSNGQGTYTYLDGNKYVGKFKDDNFNGQGTYTYSDGGTYVGEYKNGNINGQGTLTLPDGTKYVGEFKDNKFNGQGTLTYPDGDIKSGRWENNQFFQ